MLLRDIVFLAGCMGTRFGLAYIAYAFPEFLPLLATLALIPAIGFMLIFINGWRKTGAEVFGGKLWWNALRPVHAALYALFALLVFTVVYAKHAWKVLFIDALIGLVAFIIARWIKRIP